MTSTHTVNRRSLFAAGAAAALGLACTASSALATESSPQDAAAYDAIVVGTGFAGLSAALEAQELGANVLLIDKCAEGGAGGNSLVSGGGMAVPSDSSPEAVEAFLASSVEMSLNQADEALLRAMAQGALDAKAWMEGHGCEFRLEVPMAYNCNTCLLTSAADGVTALLEAYESQGGEVRYDTRLLDFLVDEMGKVSGVKVLTPEGIQAIASRAVIVCTGGYASNKQFLEQYVDEDADQGICRGRPYITGDAVQPILTLGGQLVNARGLASVHVSCVYPGNPALQPSGIVMAGIAVNKDGKRYVDEGPSYQMVGKTTMKQPGSRAYAVWDRELMENIADSCATFEGFGLTVYSDDTIEGLAEQMGLPADALAATVEEFNAHVNEDGATSGLEVDKSVNAKALAAPFYGAAGFRCGYTLSFGGVRIDDRAQVLRADGAPIGGLYAAGEVTGGFFHNDYIGGSSIARCVTFGRIAAREAVGPEA